mmetsp:Transcript_5751/g.10353  ORF Transcript_5751/g.10353 Transcript_5751/m.10353 type:complete len:248 (+) Transcript_5751:86-829(+)
MERVKAELLFPLYPSPSPSDVVNQNRAGLLPAFRPVKDAAFRQLKDYKPIAGLESRTHFKPKTSHLREDKQLPKLALKSGGVSTMGVRTFLRTNEELKSSPRRFRGRALGDRSPRKQDEHVGLDVQSLTMKPKPAKAMACSLGFKTMQAPTVEVPRTVSERRVVAELDGPKPSVPRIEELRGGSPSSPKGNGTTLPPLVDASLESREEELARIQKRYKLYVAPDSELWAQRRQAKNKKIAGQVEEVE